MVNKCCAFERDCVAIPASMETSQAMSSLDVGSARPVPAAESMEVCFKNSFGRSPVIGSETMIIGTHHKTGCYLMEGIFSEIADNTGLNYFICSTGEIPKTLKGILFDNHSLFNGVDLENLQGAKGVHIIRDARRVIVSCAFYHQCSDERWLHIPQERFGGLTYQQKILSLPTDRDRFLFEMDESGRRSIKAMESWCARNYEWCLNVKLEDLMLDEGLDHFHKVFRHLGFKGDTLLIALQIAYKHSLFNPLFESSHARSRKPEHWQKYFDTDLLQYFINKFGPVVEKLGYNYDEIFAPT